MLALGTICRSQEKSSELFPLTLTGLWSAGGSEAEYCNALNGGRVTSR